MLERLSHANLVKFCKTKCKAFYPFWDKPKYKYRLGRECTERSPAKKDLGQCTLITQKANHALSMSIRLREVIFLSSPHL